MMTMASREGGRQNLYSIFPPPELAFAKPSARTWGADGEVVIVGDAEADESACEEVWEPRPRRSSGSRSRSGCGTEVVGVMEVLVGW